MRLKRLISAAAFISALILMSACSALFPAEEKTTPPPLLEPAAITYITEAVTRGDVAETANIAGTFTALEVYNLMFERRGGYITEVNILEMKKDQVQKVSKGEVLVAFDTYELKKQVSDAEFALELQQIEYSAAQRQLGLVTENYERVSAVAAEDLKSARRDIEAKRALHEAGAISDTELANAESSYISKVSDIESRVAQAKTTVAAQKDTTAKVDINLRLAQTKLDNLREDLDKAVIRSPIDGIITYAVPLIIGDFMDARKPIVTVSNDSQLCLKLTDSSIYALSDFAYGAEVTVRIRQNECRGKVIQTPSEKPENAYFYTAPYVLVEVYDLPASTTIGTLAHASVVREKRENVIVVPRNAVSQYGTYAYVKVFEDGVSKERPVEVGLKSMTVWEIKSGLKEGELIIVN